MAQQTFAYTALDASGMRRTGAVEAENREAAVARLASEGRFVLEIGAASRPKETASGTSGRIKAPSKQDLALFTRRLADLASAGLPLDRVLQVVAEQSESGALKRISEEALVDVRSGMPISQALAKHPKYFNSVFTQTLRAGEASGQFGEVASRLADYQEKEVTRRGQVTSALVYPAVLATTSGGVIVFLITFVLPRLSGVFAEMGNDLPLTTKTLLALSAFITQYWLFILVALGGAVFWPPRLFQYAGGSRSAGPISVVRAGDRSGGAKGHGLAVRACPRDAGFRRCADARSAGDRRIVGQQPCVLEERSSGRGGSPRGPIYRGGHAGCR